MAKVTPILWDSRTSKSGKYPIKIRITNTINGKTYVEYEPVGYSVAVNEWDYNNKIVKKHPLATDINGKIKDMVYILEKKDIKGETIHLGNTESFFWWFDEYLKNCKAVNTETTYRNMFVFRNYLKNYCQSDLLLKHLNVKFIRDLQTHMLTYGFNKRKKGMSPNSVLGYLDWLKAVCNFILEDENVDWKTPFIKRSNIKREKKQQARLTLDQIILFLNADLSSFQKLARDMWIAAFYGGGMRFWDVMLLNENFIHENKLKYSTHKTKVDIDLPLLPEFIQVMKQYDFQFPFKCDKNTTQKEIRRINCNYDGHLKRAAKSVGLPKISFHTARYSFLDHLILMGLTPTEAQVAVGHGVVNTTIRYMKSSYSEQINGAMLKAFPQLSTLP